MRIITVFVIIIFFMNGINSHAQFYWPRIAPINVQENGANLAYPLGGGMNNPQFSPIDVNNDGLDDLFIFDRSNGHVNIFTNDGIVGQIAYTHAPDYASAFPLMSDWALLKDYNMDGLPDIFTYNSGGFSVFKASENTEGELDFELVKDELLYEGFSGIIGIFVSSVDIPAVVDVNEDGDIDILTFNSNGGVVEYFENQSQELYGHSDSLVYERLDRCWGNFYETSTSHVVVLDTTCTGGMQGNNTSRHAGSALVAFDADGDEDKDLLLSDVSFPLMNLLTNGGDLDYANISAQDSLFPANDIAVNLYNFPAAFYLDVDNDELNDLLIAPNQRQFALNKDHVWHYKNTGSSSEAIFEWQEEAFLIGDMIDVGERSYPSWVDYNNDGLLDLLVGNYGYFDLSDTSYTASLTLYENVGSLDEPAFELISTDFSNLSQYGLFGIYPSFGDMDGDGDTDMIAGDSQGFLHYFENTAGASAPMELVEHSLYFLEVDNGDVAAPCLYDVDSDGLLDLIIGEKAGKLNHLRNSSMGNELSFTTESTFWGSVDVRQNNFPFGYSSPFIFEEDGQRYLLVNTYVGNIYLYTDLDQAEFTLLTTNFSAIDEGGVGGISIADLYGSGKPTLCVGNHRGGIALFGGNAITPNDNITAHSMMNIFPNPSNGQFNITLNEDDFPEEVQIEIRNTQGALVGTKQTRNGGQLSISLLNASKGLYICSILSDQGRSTQKIMVF